MLQERSWLVAASVLAVAASCTLHAPNPPTDGQGEGGQQDGASTGGSVGHERPGAAGDDSTSGSGGEGEPSSSGGSAGSAGSSASGGGPPVVVNGVDCGPGNFAELDKNGKPTSCVPCTEDEWDQDKNSATVCWPKTVCKPGFYVKVAGSATADRACEACVGGYTAANNETDCKPWPICPAGSSTTGATTDRSKCVKATQLEAGLSGACATFEDGTLWCWGEYPAVSLSQPDAYTYVPKRNTDISQIAKLSMKLDRICAITKSKTVKCWGNGDLGDGTTFDSKTPVAVSGVTDAVDVSPGSEHTCVLSSHGLVRCWGDDIGGALGTSPSPDGLAGVVAGLTDVTAMGAGWRFGCGILANAKVSCWGINTEGELGAGISDETSPTPLEVVGVTGAVQLSVGYWHSCVVNDQGEVVCWGGNSFGQLGRGSATPQEGAAKIPGLTGVAEVRASLSHSCALLTTGRVKCWGSNNSGQLGNAHVEDSYTPVDVLGIDTATSIAVGGDFTCALLQEGSIRCWGYNQSGQLGIGDKVDLSLLPAYVVGAPE